MQEVGARTLITAPSVEPFSTAEAKLQLRISTTTEDALVARIIKTARKDMESYLRRPLISQKWNVKFERFPCYEDREIILPYPTLISVEFVKYYDANGDIITLSTDLYEGVTGADGMGRIVLKPGQVWPVTEYQRYLPVEIQYTAGFGTAATDIPEPIMNAMLLQMGDLYENRQNFVIGTIATSIPVTGREMISEYRALRFF